VDRAAKRLALLLERLDELTETVKAQTQWIAAADESIQHLRRKVHVLGGLALADHPNRKIPDA
jgi:uncharacterized coiled-coil protein SlyX